VQIYAAIGSSKENQQRRLLTNMGLMMKCPSQAGKLIRGHRLMRTGAVEEFSSENICSLHADANSAAQRLVQVMGSTCHDLKLGRRTVQGIRMTQQLTKQELADGAARWACRTWVGGSHSFPRSWDHRAERG